MAALRRLFKRPASLQTSAQDGDMDAQYFRLGMSYYNGDGVSQNFEYAVRWFEMAAESGHPEAGCMLGQCYESGLGVIRSLEKAVLWYRKAANMGDEGAQLLLESLYSDYEVLLEESLDLVKQSSEDIARSYRKIADMGDADAQFSLGTRFHDGEGVGQSFEEAARWWKLAADQGNMMAQFRLGVLYFQGQGVEQSSEEGVRWLKLAADQGSEMAQLGLGVLYHEGHGVVQSFEKAAFWLRKAADQGDAEAQSMVGVLFEFGKGVGQSFEEAAYWTKEAADQGLAVAQSNLGELYAEGLGVEQSWDKAFSWFEAASNQQDPAACVCLAWLLWTGTGGVRKDTARAEALCAAVQEMGHSALADDIAIGPFWPRVLAWFKETSAAPYDELDELRKPFEIDDCGSNEAEERDDGEVDECAMEEARGPGAGDQGDDEASRLDRSLSRRLAKLKKEMYRQDSQAVESENGEVTGYAIKEARGEGDSSDPFFDALMDVQRRSCEPKECSHSDLHLTELDKVYLSKVLGREGDLAAVDRERADIIGDERMLRYYHAMQQVLSWLFMGAQAYCSNLVTGKHDKVTRGLVLAASKIVGLVPVIGQIAGGAISFAAGEIAGYFDGVNAERIARAGGTDGPRVAEGVARFMVFARKDALSKLPMTGGTGAKKPYEEEVAKLVKQDVELMMGWVKGERSLHAIREDADFSGEGVIRRLVDAAKVGGVKIPAVKPGVAVVSQAVGAVALIAQAAPSLAPNIQPIAAHVAQAAAETSARDVDAELARVRAQLADLEAWKRKSEAASQREASHDVDIGGGQAYMNSSVYDRDNPHEQRACQAKHHAQLEEHVAFLSIKVNELEQRALFYERQVDRHVAYWSKGR